jgi:lipoyl(octanoyl) transferase
VSGRSSKPGISLKLKGRAVEIVWLGEVGYRDALDVQLSYLDRRAARGIPDTLLLLTHPHVYTLGRAGDEANLLVSRETLASEGIPLERVGRGGDITYHGPGQLVGYPIVLMEKPDVHKFVRSVEAALIDAVRAFGVASRRIEGLTGVWAGERKIASIGVGIRKWVTYHGFALNVTTDLSRFRQINLCGLKGREATSILEETGSAPSMEAVREAVADACDRHLEGFA